MPQVGEFIRAARARHDLSQQSLAHRVRTSQRQISRIERGETSPSVETLGRLLTAMGERLELRAVPGPLDNRTDDELRADLEHLTAADRVVQTAALSRVLTGIAGQR